MKQVHIETASKMEVSLILLQELEYCYITAIGSIVSSSISLSIELIQQYFGFGFNLLVFTTFVFHIFAIVLDIAF